MDDTWVTYELWCRFWIYDWRMVYVIIHLPKLCKSENIWLKYLKKKKKENWLIFNNSSKILTQICPKMQKFRSVRRSIKLLFLLIA